MTFFANIGRCSDFLGHVLIVDYPFSTLTKFSGDLAFFTPKDVQDIRFSKTFVYVLNWLIRAPVVVFIEKKKISKKSFPEAFLGPFKASMMELFYEYNQWLKAFFPNVNWKDEVPKIFSTWRPFIFCTSAASYFQGLRLIENWRYW